MEANNIAQALEKINKRLEALEVIHTRYTGPRGLPGERGPVGLPGKDGKDATADERNAFREYLNGCRSEINALRSDLHALHRALCAELRELYDAYAEQLGSIYSNEVNAFCATRDEANAARKS